MQILRVFPRRTSYTPKDSYAFVGDPPLWRPDADHVEVSCAFTWDIDEAERLAAAWAQYYPTYIGGPAIDDRPPGNFVYGRFVKPGVTFTTRGCVRNCPWCLVPKREGKLRVLPIVPGHIIQDNNLLAADPAHISAVFDMLKAQQKAAIFAGGLDPRLIDDTVAGLLRDIRIKAIFLSCDMDEMLDSLQDAAHLLTFLGREKLRCYAMLGYGDDTPEKAERRLKAVWNAGCIPFAQLYQPPGEHLRYSAQWRKLAWIWSRPAAMRSVMKHD